MPFNNHSPILINPAQLDTKTTEILHQFLLQEVQSSCNWDNIVQYPMPKALQEKYGQAHIQFVFAMILRGRNPGPKKQLKNEWRIEVYNPEKCIGSGAQASIFATEGTLHLTPSSLTFHTKKPRVIKFFNSGCDSRLESRAPTPHLHPKPMLRISDDRDTIVMRKMSGISFGNFILDKSIKSLKIHDRLTLTLNTLKSYQEQVTKQGLIHRDIKPANMMIDPKDLSINFIDYGLACFIGGTVLSPLPDHTVEKVHFLGESFEKKKSLSATHQPAPEADTGFKLMGTIGWIPAEGYSNGLLSITYDYFALAKIIACIWLIFPHKNYTIMEIPQAMSEASNTNYHGKISHALIPNPYIRNIIEDILTRMSSPSPTERPNMDAICEVFMKLEIPEPKDLSLLSSKKEEKRNLSVYSRNSVATEKSSAWFSPGDDVLNMRN